MKRCQVTFALISGLATSGVLAQHATTPFFPEAADDAGLDPLAHASVGCDGSGQTVGFVVPSTETDEWASPASYYSNISGTGATLASTLRNAMSAGHIQRRYGDFRNSAVIHDADPNQTGNILLSYNVASVGGQWDSGSTWNREHVWPVSRQPGSASNSSTGNLGDPHSLRPCNPSINSSRGNKPFGLASTTGNFRSLGTYYFPGDTDKASIARSLFYSATRYSLQLVDGVPSGNQMGDLASLVEWHYQEKPSTFERRRNHTIYSSAFNPSFFTNNRNAYVDLPGAVWSVFRDNNNDSQLWVGDAPGTDGGSVLDLCQRLIVGSDPQGFEVTLSRAGQDGVYYAVVAGGDAITDQPLTNGFTDTFAINDAAPRPIVVGVDPAAISGAGMYSGDIVIDNLDMTDGLGSGFGAQDADDQIIVTAELYDPSAASFESAATVQSTTVNFGSIGVSTVVEITIPVHALEATPGFTAGSTITLLSSSGDASAFTVTPPSGVIQAGTSGDIVVSAELSASGAFNAEFTLQAADDPGIEGAAPRSTLSITAIASAGPCVADIAPPFGVLDLTDIDTFVAAFVASDLTADIAAPFGVLDVSDIDAFIVSFLSGCP
ncbi:MAG: endonuclease [Planctomycetota bacterium]